MGIHTRYKNANRRTVASEEMRKAAVEKSLRELEVLFKRPPDTNTKARRQPGLGETELSKLPANNITKLGGAA